MMAPANIAASVRQRLLNLARAENRPFNELLQYYAMERFLYRLSRSGHSERFILKGALMLRVWNSPAQRPTMDIDLLGITSNRPEDVSEVIREIMDVEVEPDGLVYSPASVRAERITEDAEYDGIRIRFDVRLDTARIFMQVDIGFGDAVHPAPVVAELPTILGDRAPRLLCYSRDSVIAEKLEAMPEVDYVVITAGTYDVLVEVVCEDDDHLLDVINRRIRGIPGVRHTESFVYLKLRKQIYTWGTR
jgi:DNA-binding Lrp family transcriptional regulator